MVPLTFARTAANCPHRNAAFSAAGSPMLARAMDSWEAALCAGSHGLTINYDPVFSEPLSLEELASGEADVALTTRTAGAQGINTGPKHYVYAPVAVSAVSVAYWFDSPVTGLPQTGVKLDQRLVLKLLTQSYAFLNDGCPQHPKSAAGLRQGGRSRQAQPVRRPGVHQAQPGHCGAGQRPHRDTHRACPARATRPGP